MMVRKISSGTRKRSTGLFENIQDRFILDGSGEARVKMTIIKEEQVLRFDWRSFLLPHVQVCFGLVEFF